MTLGRGLTVAVGLSMAVAGVALVAWGHGVGPLALAVERDRAEQLYRRRAWHQADTAYSALVRETTKRRRTDDLPPLAYASGNVAYRLGRFEEAVRRFQGGLTGRTALRERTYFNLGNSYVWQARAEYSRQDKRSALRGAIDSYEQALTIDPHDADAKWNLEIALLRLEEADSAGSGLHRGDANWGGGNLTKSGYEGAPQTGAGASPGGGYGASSGEDAVSQITETQARQLLKTVERAQVTGQQVGLPKPATSRGPSHERDW
jgi:hypothetical protein